MVNLSPVLISGGLCCYLSKYYVGKISKSAIDWLLMGRLFSLVLKGLIIFGPSQFSVGHTRYSGMD